jgi:nucleoside-diphosphate-sugar epimerase
MKQKVLVTGSAGYIGSILLPSLIQDNYSVVGLDTNLYPNRMVTNLYDTSSVIKKDIRDVTEKDLEGFDSVIHLAGLSNDPLGELDRDLTYAINYHAAVRLAKIAKSVGVKRFIFASSCSVYGDGGDSYLIESSQVNPQTAYAETKYLAEKEIVSLVTDFFSPVIVRAGTVYGFAPNMRFDLVVNIFIRNVLTGVPLKIFGSGALWRPLIEINDVVKVYKALLKAPKGKIHGEVFNIGATKENYQVKDIAQKIQDFFPQTIVEYIPSEGKDGRDYKASCQHFESTFPEVRFTSLNDGMLKLYEHLKIYPEKVLNDPAFVRIKTLKNLLEIGVIKSSLRAQVQV